ncbi:MAG: SGNH/GDSL hydrolase family protein [Patescibacteria group bacterium]|jgi:lysophospholipase L1-like esterase
MKNSKKILLAVILVIIIILAVYLNRAYAYIYHKIGEDCLPPQNSERTYEIGTSSASTIFTYTALGDSLTAGVGTDNIRQSFPYLIAQNLTAKYGQVKLVDLGVPGAKSKNVLFDQLSVALATNSNYVTILVGINDIHGLVPVNAFKKNILEIINELKSKTQAEVVLVNLPYIGSPKLFFFPYNFYFGFRTWQYNRVIKEICAGNQIKCVDLYSPNQKFIKNDNFYASDNFHPSADGYLLWSKIIYAD